MKYEYICITIVSTAGVELLFLAYSVLTENIGSRCFPTVWVCHSGPYSLFIAQMLTNQVSACCMFKELESKKVVVGVYIRFCKISC